MAPKKPPPEPGRKSNKFRMVVFEGDFSDESVSEIAQALTQAVAGGKKFIGFAVTKREDFEEFMESQVLDIAGAAGIFPSKNIKTILDVQLKKRNLAAHPSLVAIGSSQADDAITSLVQNVVLVLT